MAATRQAISQAAGRLAFILIGAGLRPYQAWSEGAVGRRLNEWCGNCLLSDIIPAHRFGGAAISSVRHTGAECQMHARISAAGRAAPVLTAKGSLRPKLGPAAARRADVSSP